MDFPAFSKATMQRIARRYAGGHVHGIDHSKEAVALARETNQKTIEAGRMTVRRASVERLPFDSGSIDMAVSVESLYFWPRPDAGLGEICRVLRHGGQLVIALEAYENGNLPESVQANAQQFGLFMPTMGELRCLLREAGQLGQVVPQGRLAPGQLQKHRSALADDLTDCRLQFLLGVDLDYSLGT